VTGLPISFSGKHPFRLERGGHFSTNVAGRAIHRTGAATVEDIHGRAATVLVDSDEVARAFRDDVARYSDMMSPGSGASLAWNFSHSNAEWSILGMR
jgi:hypothetical protein